MSVGRDSASDGAIDPSSSVLLGEEHDDDPDPIFPMEPSEPLSMPESVGLSSFRVMGWTGRVTAVMVVPAGIFGCVSVADAFSSSIVVVLGARMIVCGWPPFCRW